MRLIDGLKVYRISLHFQNIRLPDGCMALTVMLYISKDEMSYLKIHQCVWLMEDMQKHPGRPWHCILLVFLLSTFPV